MIPFEDFLQLPTEDVAALVRTSGRKVCGFPANGTRRWFMLEHADKVKGDFFEAYLKTSIQNHVDLCTLLFDHGIDTILAPMFGRELMLRGDEYTKRVGMDGLAHMSTNKTYLDFFEQYNVKVRFYGDYREILTGTPYEHALKSMDEVMEATKHNTSFRLFFGIFADQMVETIARLSVEHYLTEGSIPDRQTLIRKYYGEDLNRINLFIGFDKFAIFDIPLLTTGDDDLYFSVSPSPYMTQTQLRVILYDHIYVRRVPEPEYTKLTDDELGWLRDYYHKNRDNVFGVGRLKFNIWIPEKGNEE